MLLVQKYDYPTITRLQTKEGRRYNTPTGEKLPSVTTILSKTVSEEKTKILKEWRKRVGDAEAEKIVTEAASRGTLVHKFIENYLAGIENEEKGNLIFTQARQMAQLVIDNYIVPDISEIWGSEVSLYYEGCYAGTTDCAGIYKNQESIIDFKQSNKPKKKEWIEDYFIQLAAYGMAHNKMFNTNINQGVILMVTPDNILQQFIIKDQEFEKYKLLWAKKVEQFYSM